MLTEGPSTGPTPIERPKSEQELRDEAIAREKRIADVERKQRRFTHINDGLRQQLEKAVEKGTVNLAPRIPNTPEQ